MLLLPTQPKSGHKQSLPPDNYLCQLLFPQANQLNMLDPRMPTLMPTARKSCLCHETMMEIKLTPATSALLPCH
jgi:hypothetical protein